MHFYVPTLDLATDNGRMIAFAAAINNSPTVAAEDILADLYDAYWHGQASLPDDPQWSLNNLDDFGRATRVADYLAGMTDRYAVAEHRRLFDRTPELG